MNWQVPPNWQPPPPPPRPGMPPPGGGAAPGGGGGSGGGGGQQGGQPGGQPGGGGGGGAGTATAQAKTLSLYELLQVDRNAHSTIIRYAYRYLAAMFHPDNSETGDAEKFRIITDAWKTLSDDTRRQAYDMTLAVQDASKPASKQAGGAPSFGRESMPKFERTSLTWNEVELRVAVLQVLLAQRRKKPASGGCSGKMLMDVLQIDDVTEVEFALWYLREKSMIETGERAFMITAIGLDYLTSQLSQTQILDGGSNTEKKTTAAVNAGLPAILGHKQ